jgi:membrane protein DedA with SNARE-associated domain
MLELFIHWIESIVIPYGGWGIFAASIVEEVIVPVPSTLVQMGGGFILMGGLPVTLSHVVRLFSLVVIPATVGLTIGSLFAFLLGRYGAEPFFRSIGKYLGVTWEDILLIAEKMKNKGNIFWILVLVRSIPVMPAAVASAAAGLLQFRMFPYIIATLLGTLIRASILGFLGWQLGVGYKSIAPHIERFENIGLLVLLVVIGCWWIRKRRAKTPL